MEKILFKNKYRIQSARMKNWNYSWNGCYYVTIVAKNRECVFGDIINCEMELSIIGKIVRRELLKTEKIRQNIKLDQWVIMPDHVHLIIGIDNLVDCNARKNALHARRDALQCVSTGDVMEYAGGYYKNKFGPQKNNLSSIIRGIKSSVKRICDKYKFKFWGWQARFHDRIIRNEQELNRIREYIQNNPRNWRNDRNNSLDL